VQYITRKRYEKDKETFIIVARFVGYLFNNYGAHKCTEDGTY